MGVGQLEWPFSIGHNIFLYSLVFVFRLLCISVCILLRRKCLVSVYISVVRSPKKVARFQIIIFHLFLYFYHFSKKEH